MKITVFLGLICSASFGIAQEHTFHASGDLKFRDDYCWCIHDLGDKRGHGAVAAIVSNSMTADKGLYSEVVAFSNMESAQMDVDSDAISLKLEDGTIVPAMNGWGLRKAAEAYEAQTVLVGCGERRG